MPLNLEAMLIRWGVVLAIGAALFGLGWVKGAAHEQVKAAAFQGGVVALGKAQVAHNAVIAANQGKVVENVTSQVKSATAASDTYWLRHAGSGGCPVSGAPIVTSGTQPASPPAEPNPARCSEADGAADAIQVIELQRFYQGLIDAQK